MDMAISAGVPLDSWLSEGGRCFNLLVMYEKPLNTLKGDVRFVLWRVRVQQRDTTRDGVWKASAFYADHPHDPLLLDGGRADPLFTSPRVGFVIASMGIGEWLIRNPGGRDRLGGIVKLRCVELKA